MHIMRQHKVQIHDKCKTASHSSGSLPAIWNGMEFVGVGTPLEAIEMSFDDDKMVRFMRLDKLRRELMWVKLDLLELQNLQPLRDEIVEKMEQIRSKTK